MEELLPQAPVPIPLRKIVARKQHKMGIYPLLKMNRYDEGEDEALYIIGRQGHGLYLPIQVNFDTNRTSRVGWIAQEPRKIICHVCYAFDNILPQDRLKLSNLEKVVITFQSLTDEDKKKLPETLY